MKKLNLGSNGDEIENQLKDKKLKELIYWDLIQEEKRCITWEAITINFSMRMALKNEF